MVVILIATACSKQSQSLETIIHGTITVADSVDSSNDFSGIGISIINRDSASAENDTLFHEITNKKGEFKGQIQFPEKRYYTMFVSRNGAILGDLAVILAPHDTLKVQAELPDINGTAELQSYEHDAMKVFVRVDQTFKRISAFARAGAIPDSQLTEEARKWTDLYWEVYEEHENTIASYLAAEKAINLLRNWDQDEMLKRLDEALPEDYMINVALNVAKPYIAETKGFDAASNYLDSLARISESPMMTELLSREKIKMHFDSSRIKEAKTLLNSYEEQYSESSSSKKWASRIRYDLNYLAPGVTAPNFSFVTMQGDTVNNQNLKGSVYILEISPLANFEYQNAYDRTLIIHEIYKNYGLKILTIPLDYSELTVDGFFEERRKVWPVAKIGSFDVQQVIQKFNVNQIPTRFLIDENGVLIRKYERREFQDVIQGLNRAFRNNNSPS